MTTTYRQSREANRPNIGARCALPPRDRVLEVACEMFAEAGFHGTHFREMCKRAGTNVAGICYHFESKEGLYQAVLMEAGRRLSHRDKDLTGCCARLPSDQRLLKLTEWLLQKMSESHAWIGKLLARELLDPECGAHTYVASGLEKVCALLQYVMKDLLRANASPEAVRLHALHLMGECVFYSLAAENPNHPLTQLSAVPSSRTRLAQFLTERSLAALQTGRGRIRSLQSMNRHPSISADSRAVKQTGTASSWTKWPVQLRVSRRQHERFVPLVARLRAKVSGGELFQIVSAS